MELVINHPGGTRTLEAARVHPRTAAFHLTAQTVDAPLGDAGDRPGEYVVSAAISGGTLAESYELARTIVAEAEQATDILTHEGGRRVDGIGGYLIAPDGQGVLLTLQFVPTAVPIFEETFPTFDSTLTTFDSTFLSWDNEAAP